MGEGSPPPPKPPTQSWAAIASSSTRAAATAAASPPVPPPMPPPPSAAPPPLPPKPPPSRLPNAKAMDSLLAAVPSEQFHGLAAPPSHARPPSYSAALGSAAPKPTKAAVRVPDANDGVASEETANDGDYDSLDELHISTAVPASRPAHLRRGSKTSAFRPAPSRGGGAAVGGGMENWTQDYKQSRPSRWDEQVRVTDVSQLAGDDGWGDEHPTPTGADSPQERYLESLAAGSVEMRREFSSHRGRTRRSNDLGFGGLGSGWTSPKIIEQGGSEDRVGGIWGDKSVLDFDVLPTPSDQKWPPMGETIVVKRGRAISVTDKGKAEGAGKMAVDAAEEDEEDEIKMDDSEETTSARARSASSELPPSTYRTITEYELQHARPHPNLYYSRSTHSWALFAQLERQHPEPAPTLSPYFTERRSYQGTTPLWTMQALGAAEIAVEVEPPLPEPILPAREASLSKEASYMADSATARPDYDDLTLICTKEGRRIAYSVLEFYPAVIPREVWNVYKEDRRSDPIAGQSPEESWYRGVAIIWQSIDNLLFKGEYRPVKIEPLRNHLNWNKVAADIFIGFLGFTLCPDDSLSPPDVSEETPEGRMARRRLLQCWLEMGLWIEDFKLRNSVGAAKPGKITRVSIKPSAEPALLESLGGDKLDRQPPSQQWSVGMVTEEEQAALRNAYHVLGVTKNLADSVIVDVFRQQLAFSTLHGAIYLQAIDDINKHRHAEELTMLLASERSTGGYTTADITTAYSELRLPGPPSGWHYLDDDAIVDAYSKREEHVEHPERKKVLKDAFKLIADVRSSELLKTIVNSTSGFDDASSKPQMTLERAYRLLDIPVEGADSTDDGFVCTLYDLAVDATPLQKGALTEALKVIGEARNSDEIQKRLQGEMGGQGGWEAGPSVALDIPVGLTNIANTCYLNSLLQYFFTVRELRETILQFAKGQKTENGDQFNRVGGRLVTKAEVERSKRFVELLQGLFSSLINAPVTAITPETELAYLALVPSKDEEAIKKPALSEAEIKPVASVADEDDDLIIVDPREVARTSSSPVVVPSPASPSTSSGVKSPSILGKRRNDQLDGSADADLNIEPMHIDSQSPSTTADDIVVDDPAPLSPSSDTRKVASDAEDRSAKRGRSLEASISTLNEPEKIHVDEPKAIDPNSLPPLPAEKSAPPPLPPRPTPNLEQEVSNYMAFGRQNDVTECMDNVMFQIECALKPTGEGEESVAAGVLKRTFYGKTRQQLEFSDASIAEPIRTKEEPFFSLLVDVAEEGRNVYDGLDAVFDDSPVEIEGKPARRRVSLVEMPALLQIQLQRVQYDREKQKTFKSNQHMAFGPEISMDRYLQVDDNDVEGKQRRDRTSKCREEMDKCRTRLSKLKNKSIDVPKLLFDTFTHLSHQPDLQDILTPELSEGTIAEHIATQEQVNCLESRISELRQEIERIWAGQHKATYELVSVFIHRGTALSGHYFIYQRDSKNPKRWLKYNDSVITEIDPAEAVFAETTGDTNAYFLVYCKKDRLDAIDSMCRQL